MKHTGNRITRIHPFHGGVAPRNPPSPLRNYEIKPHNRRNLSARAPRLTLLVFLALLAEAPFQPAEASICSRTTEVQNAIIAKVFGKTTCGQITATDLAGIKTLSITPLFALTRANKSNLILKSGDFDGLTGLTNLSLFGNFLSSLPAGLFDELTSLTSLNLKGNTSLTCLPFIPSSVTTLSLDKARSTYSACGAGVTVGATDVSVEAGATKTYSLVLDAYPTGDVTVTPASSATATATVSSALTFTQSNWSTSQSVTVTGVAVGSATASHTVSGGGYGSATAANVAVTVLSLTASSVTHNSATLTLGNYSGNWWLKRTTPADTTCKSKGTTAIESLSSLDSNTNYTYKAYSNSNCSTELASETLLTKPGKPTKPVASAGAGSGTLTLTASVTGSGTLTKWQYKKKEGTGNFDDDWTDISSTSTSLSHTFTGLTDGTDYQFKLRASNATGDSAESDASAAVQPADESLTASSVTHNAATLTLGNYSGNWWLKRTTPADTTCKSKGTTATESLSSLDSNTNYTYKAYSNSNCSTELASETLLTKPGKPTQPVATAGAGSGTLTLTASVTGSGTLTKWQYKQKEGTGNFDDDWTDISSTSTSLSHTFTGLTDGTDYQFKVRASNATGDSAESDASAAVQPADESLTASSVTHNAATLTLGNYSGSWWLKRTTPADTTCKSKGTTATEALTGLSSNTSYTYKAYSNSNCSTELASETFLTKPGKPTQPVAAIGAGSGKLTVTASVTGGGTLTKWEYTQREGKGNFDSDWTTISSTSNLLSHTVTGLTNGTNYQFKVRAVNATGNGADSDASAPVQPKAVTLAASAVEAATATLTISNHAGDWYYKANAAPDESCSSSAVTGATEALTGLSSNTSYTYKAYRPQNQRHRPEPSSNTSYTYKAYSNSTCTTELASETFLTKPGKPTKPVAAIGAGSGKLTVTASVTGGGTLTKWEYKQKEGTGNYSRWTTISSTSTSLSHTVTGLTDGTNYQFKVRAVNATGNGAESDASATVQPKAVTLAASAVEAATATLTIANHTGDWYYKANAAPDASCSASAVTGATEALTGLSSNTSYTYTAYSDSGCSTLVATASAFLTKPGKPTKPVAAIGAGSGTLTVTASVTGGGTLTKWEYKQKEGAGNFDSDWTTISSTSTSLSHTVTGLTNDTDYQFKVRAVNATGNGAESEASTAVQPKAVTLTASAVEAATATLTIAHHAGDWYYKANAAPDAACSASAVTGATEALTGLSSNTSYTYKAYRDSSCGTLVATATAFLTKPGKPTQPVAAIGAGSGTLTVTASVTGGGTLTKWEYKQKEGTGNFDASWTTISSTSTSLSHTVTGLTDGTNYQFKVRAVNATGNGADSDASATVQPKAVTLTASAVEAATATLTIAHHAGDWYYKANAAPDAACSASAVTGATEALTGLSSNTSYTYKAYRDSSCGTLVATATALLTKPGKPTQPVAAIGAGSGTLTVTASVTGGGTLTKWEYKQKEGTGNFDASWTTISSTSTSLSHTVTGLTDGTNYQFKVRAVNATGNGADSDASATVQPKAVTLTASAVEAATATLTIAHHAGDWYYKANAAPDAACSASAVTGATEALTGLSSNTSYTYKAYRDSSCGTLVATATALLTKPGKPTQPVAAIGAGSGTLTVTASVTGGGTLTKWEYKQKEGTGNFDASWTTISSTSTSLSHTVTGLTDGTNYQFKVRAVNATGNGADSDASATVQPKAVTLTASAVEAATATLTIAHHAGDWYYKANAAPDAACSASAVTGATEALTGLSSNTSYTYKAYRDSSCGTLVATATALLTKPGKPTQPVATAGAGSGTLTLTASVTGSGTLSKWQYKQKEGTGNFDDDWSDIASTSTSLSHTFTGLTDGTDYQFKVRASNASGDSAESDASAAVAPADESLTASSVTHHAATLTLGNYSGSWWLKRTTPADTTCKSKGTTATEALTGLSSNTSYTYKAYSNSNCSTELASETLLTKPGKPTQPVATAGAGSGTLTLTASVTGSGTLSKWQYKQKEGTGNFDDDWSDIASTSTSLSHTFTGLTDGTDYQFKVRASNASGDSAESDASAAVAPADESLTASSVTHHAATLTLGNYSGSWWLKRTTPADTTCKSKGTTATEALTGLSSNTSYTYKAYSNSNCSTELASETLLTKPGKPTQPVAAIGAGSGTLTLTASVTGSGTLSKWQYKQKEGTGNFDDDWSDIASTSTSLSHTFTGLTDGTDYQFKVRASNASGDSAESDASAAVAPADESLTASSVTHHAATLTLGNYSGSWWLKRTTPADTTGKSKGTTATEALTGLSSNTSYTYKAYSNSNCSTELASETLLTKPGKPTQPVATAGAGSGTLTLTASVTGSGTLSKWQYKQKEGTGNFDDDWSDIASTSTSLSHTFTGLTDGTDYQFKVRASNASGDSAESDASAAVAPADESLTASSVTHHGATLTLGNYSGSWWLKANAAPTRRARRAR